MLYLYFYHLFMYCDQVDWSLKPGRNVTFVSLMLKKPNVSEVQIQGFLCLSPTGQQRNNNNILFSTSQLWQGHPTDNCYGLYNVSHSLLWWSNAEAFHYQYPVSSEAAGPLRTPDDEQRQNTGLNSETSWECFEWREEGGPGCECGPPRW